MSATNPILPTLHAHRDALADAVRRLEWSGLETTAAAVNCRHYLGKVERWIKDPFGIEGLAGENGYAPAFRDAIKDAEFELRRLALVVVIEQTGQRLQVAA